MTIKIRKTNNADSRTSDEKLTYESLKKDTYQHIADVEEGMDFFAKNIHNRGTIHDYTKRINFDEFADNVLKEHTNEEFIASDWYQKHIFEERHHLNANCPLDVNLIDVLEMIVDCVMAGKGRSGRTTPAYLKLQDPTLLERAYWNTVKLLDEEVVIEEDEL